MLHFARPFRPDLRSGNREMLHAPGHMARPVMDQSGPGYNARGTGCTRRFGGGMMMVYAIMAVMAGAPSAHAADGQAEIAAAAPSAYASKEKLGEALFFDPNLSKNRTQACASCHDPDSAFRDPRGDVAHGAFSQGDDGVSLGDRNAPMAAYARFSPLFHIRADGMAVGGQFWDGRADDLAAQAGGPPLNPVEMGMADKGEVVARLREDDDYVQAFSALFGADVWKDADTAYGAMTQAIAAYESTDEFAPFDSKYDRYLRGEYTMTPQEELGRVLFFSQQFTNCNICHQLKKSPTDPAETFTNYEYHNIGVPKNTVVRSETGKDPAFQDNGLLDNPAIDDAKYKGLYKTPSLRNVAVSGPYMHNGVFADLRTVIKFYNKYNSRAKTAQINPETGADWGLPEVEETVDHENLHKGSALDTKRINALVAFLKTLTDARYEPLLARQDADAAARKEAAKASAAAGGTDADEDEAAPQ